MPPIPYTRRVGILVGVVGILAVGGHHRLAPRAYGGGHPSDRIERCVGLLSGQENPRIHERRRRDRAADPRPRTRPRSEAPVQKLEAARAKYAADAEKHPAGRARPRTTKATSRRAARCASTSAKACWSSGLVLCSLFFLARKSFFPDLRRALAASPAPPWASGASCFEDGRPRSRCAGAIARCSAAAALAPARRRPASLRGSRRRRGSKRARPICWRSAWCTATG